MISHRFYLGWLFIGLQLGGRYFTSAVYKVQRNLEENKPREPRKLPIIFVYSVIGEACEYGLPEYISISLQQAIKFQSSHSDIILASNFAECKQILGSVQHMTGLKLVDVNKIQTEDTSLFYNYSGQLFNHSFNSALWVTSALRFFNLLDIMNEYEYEEMLHVEADNLLYGDLSSLIPSLREGYPLAATPLASNQAYVTASVFWANSRPALQHFTEFLLNITINRDRLYNSYLGWLRRYACCKVGGVDPDANGKGIKPYAINEMSILAYYHKLYPHLLKMLPVLPYYPRYEQRRGFCRPSEWMSGGEKVGIATGDGVWDSNSWGQHLGGTHKKKGRDKGFIDNSHIVGQTMIANPCRIEMRCDNRTSSGHGGHHWTYTEQTGGTNATWLLTLSEIDALQDTMYHPIQSRGRPRLRQRQLQGQVYTAETIQAEAEDEGVVDITKSEDKSVDKPGSMKHHQKQQQKQQQKQKEQKQQQCFMAPFVRCGGPVMKETEDGKFLETKSEDREIGWTLLWNLHVHSKQTVLYQSIPCPCVATTSSE